MESSRLLLVFMLQLASKWDDVSLHPPPPPSAGSSHTGSGNQREKTQPFPGPFNLFPGGV